MAKRPVPLYDFAAFGQAIKAARTGRNESRKKVSDEMNISPRYLANIENKGQQPSLQIFYELVTRYDISVDQFFFPDKTAEKSTQRRQLDTLLDSITPDTLLLVLDGVTDPRNFGACLRVADAAGVQAVIAPRDRSASFSPAAAKAAAGAWESVPVVTVTNLAASITELRDAGVMVVGTAGEAQKTIYEFDQKRAFAWVLGAEGEGLRQLTRKRCDELAKIPMFGAVDSLNVSVATGVCLFETVRQRQS